MNISPKKYKQSDRVTKAFDDYTNYKENEKPEDYFFSDSALLGQTQDEYFNYPDFSYDVNSDPLYKQYRYLYQTQGKKAMEDTIGIASELTGGYGNSYAQTAGIISYNEYMDRLNSVIPELYAAAYSRYEADYDRLENKIDYLLEKDKEEYGRYIDQYEIYSDGVDDLRDFYFQEYENDIKTQDSDWESEYKVAKAKQDKEIADKELGYKYYAQQQENERFYADLDYKKKVEENNRKESEEKRNFEKEKADEENKRYWTEYNKENKEVLRDDEIYALMKKGFTYEAIRAIDIKYDNNETARQKAIMMGFDVDYVDAYFAAHP